MSELVNNGKYRRTTLTITKQVNGAAVNDTEWPKVHSILNAFGTYTAITEATFVTMSDTDYLTRLNAFYVHLEAMYNFFFSSQVSNDYNGADTILCPIPENKIYREIQLSSPPGESTVLGTCSITTGLTKYIDSTWSITNGLRIYDDPQLTLFTYNSNEYGANYGMLYDVENGLRYAVTFDGSGLVNTVNAC